MPAIGDFFGKASVDTDHSVATTVTADRTAGATVLSCFDLSTFTEDTPVFFVTYTKTTDPETSEVTITDLISWKGLVNSGANTITNLTVAPGYVDADNEIGQFVECIPTSYWSNELMDGLLTSLNPDGTLKDDSVHTDAVQDDAVTPAKWTNPYCMAATRTAEQTGVVDATVTVLQLNVEKFDLNDNYNNATYQYTVPVSGIYRVSMALYVESTAGLAEVAWAIAGLDVASSGLIDHYVCQNRTDTDYYGDRMTTQGSRLIQLTAGQVLRPVIFVNVAPSKTSKVLVTGEGSPWLDISLVHET